MAKFDGQTPFVFEELCNVPLISLYIVLPLGSAFRFNVFVPVSDNTPENGMGLPAKTVILAGATMLFEGPATLPTNVLVPAAGLFKKKPVPGGTIKSVLQTPLVLLDDARVPPCKTKTCAPLGVLPSKLARSFVPLSNGLDNITYALAGFVTLT